MSDREPLPREQLEEMYWTFPAETFRKRMRAVREGRGLSQARLASRLRKIIDPAPDRTAIARIETDERKVALEEFFAICAALGAAPVHMLLPLDHPEVLVMGFDRQFRTEGVREWIRGQTPLRREDRRTFYSERPDHEFDELLGIDEEGD